MITNKFFHAIILIGIGLITHACHQEFEPIELPVVHRDTLINITATSAICGGTVSSEGSTKVTAKGVCWATHYDPTIDDYITTDGSGVGSFTCEITGLTPEYYYVRAYAVSDLGIAYSTEQVVFLPHN